ncbi:type II toxin-antitoxin system PemK/MazF family toxin [Rhodospirillum centenum]|uniref:PemK-like protein n=1 Tax=Rhodospirillum centenum (strain ATCC 51521 / SW) TaxID=414684 RepID=B6IUP7_RHOCS|nr:type II toxin-antitoxin system PemK/MazF family toxin [Rhodospirillum centenum]ACI99872.1 conserved hypothetical protein [Rhodospirillum centenum SW]
MPTFEPLEVVTVPFPFVERPVLKRRPAVVISRPVRQDRLGLIWVVMITSARNEAWPGDIPVADITLAGLSRPSVIRPCKMSVIEPAEIRAIGRLDADGIDALTRALAEILPPLQPPALRP